MPELPEVEALVRFLDTQITGHRIVAADVASIAALKTFDPPASALVGRTVSGVRRYGKWIDLVCSLTAITPATAPAADSVGHMSRTERASRTADGDSDLHLVFHLARGGWVRWAARATAAPVRPRLGSNAGGRGAALAFRVRFDDGSGFDLTEAGTRKRLAVHVVRDPLSIAPIESLGIEPLDPTFTVAALSEAMTARSQQIKGLLRDQSAIAGIGNAYSDEILHAAKLSPFKLTRTFSEEEVARLHAAIGEVLTEAVTASTGKPAAELKDAKRRGMRVHGRAGESCDVCGDTVREVSFADRSLQYCATCQTGGQALADRRMSRLLR